VRAGATYSEHRVGIDAPAEVLELVHTARSAAAFAQGALAAAQWIRGRKGVFTMDDVAASVLDPLFAPSAGANAMNTPCRGLGVALATPFDPMDGSTLDVALVRLVRHVARGGADFVVALGSTGEAAMLDEAERDSSSTPVLEQSGPALVFVGTGACVDAPGGRWTRVRAKQLGAARGAGRRAALREADAGGPASRTSRRSPPPRPTCR
jgi:hypothetical protein